MAKKRAPTAERRKHVRLYCHSNEQMHELEDGEIALTVTSPPYWNAIDYDLHAADGSNAVNYRQRKYAKGFDGYKGYLDALQRTFTEVFRVTKPGGFCAIVIGTVLNRGTHIPVPFDCAARMAAIGWLFHQDIIWHKCTAGVKRAGVSIQKPYPGYFYPNIMTEYILIFRKDGPRIHEDRGPEEREESEYPINGLFTREIANNVWHIAPVPPGQVNHPCPFPEEIPDRLIRLYSFKNDTVLDPYVGSGQTIKAAVGLARKGVGYDIEARYVAESLKRAAEPSAIRAKQLVAEFTKLDLDAPLTAAVNVVPRPKGRTRHGSGGKRSPSENGTPHLFK